MGYVDAQKDGGEVQIRGGSIAKGYYRDEVRTREDFSDDGWLSTGDIGRFNANGTLKLIDRKKNIFKTSLVRSCDCFLGQQMAAVLTVCDRLGRVHCGGAHRDRAEEEPLYAARAGARQR